MPLPGMPSTGTDQLGAPPPSPTPMGGMNGQAPFSMQGLAPQIPSNRLPPEVLTGLTASAQKIGDMLDSFSQITPDKAAQLAMIKNLLQQYLADLMPAGAGPTSPTASGPAFPGGGIDRGIAGAGTI
jgi:hypothetical protein